MKLLATRESALIAGAWTGLGAVLFEGFVLRGGVMDEHARYVFFIGAVPFFFVPVFLFVFGRSDDGLIKNIWMSLGRGLCWMLGAGVVSMIGLPVVTLLHAS